MEKEYIIKKAIINYSDLITEQYRIDVISSKSVNLSQLIAIIDKKNKTMTWGWSILDKDDRQLEKSKEYLKYALSLDNNTYLSDEQKMIKPLLLRSVVNLNTYEEGIAYISLLTMIDSTIQAIIKNDINDEEYIYFIFNKKSI